MVTALNNPRKIAENAQVRYSSIRASNGKWIVLQVDNGYNAIWTAAGERYDTLPSALHHSAQVVWDWDDLDKLWFVKGTTLGTYNVVTKVITEVCLFDDYETLTSAHAEGDLTQSGFLALVGVRPNGVEVCFSYNVQTGVTGPQFPQAVPFDGIKVDESGRLILSRADGIWRFDDAPAFRIARANGHACPVRWNEMDYLLFCNSAEWPIKMPDFQNAVVMIDVATGEQRGLKSFPWQYAMHISGEIVSVYDDPAGAQTKGSPNQIWRVPLDGTTPTMLHEWASPYNRDYQPRATLSTDGKTAHFNVWDGVQCSVWQLDVEDFQVRPREPEKPQEYTELDYSGFEGQEFRFDYKVVGGKLALVGVFQKK